MTIKFLRDDYKRWQKDNPIIPEGSIVLVLNCPWYISFFGLKPTRLKAGDGKTPFRKLKFI